VETAFGSECVIISCYFYLVYNVRKQAERVNGGLDYIENSVLPMIYDLSICSSFESFSKLSCYVLYKWRKDNQFEFATWFDTTYLSNRWRNWYNGSAPITGLGLTNNPMEAFNKKVKAEVHI